jgi:hypothetical protein
MATRADFSDAEWKEMQKGLTGAGMLVSVSDTGFTEIFSEMGVLAEYLDQQREASGSELVRDLADVRVSGFGLRVSEAEAESETLDALRASTAALATKAPDEVNAYRELILGAAAAVAEAHGGVTQVENAMIAKLEAALAQE